MRILSILAVILPLSLVFSFCGLADEYVYEAKNKSARYTEDGDISLAWIVGPIIGAISVICVCVSYKRGINGEKYPLSLYSKLKLKASSDNFTHKTVIVTRIPDPPSKK